MSDRHHNDGRALSRPMRLFLATASLAVALLGAFQLGSWQGAKSVRHENSLQALNRLADERRQLQAIQASVSADLDALALQLGRMRAHMMRLDALGERLVKMGKLDAGEFDFTVDPAVGGIDGGRVESVASTDLVRELEQLKRGLMDREHKLEVLEELLVQRELDEQVTLSGKPVKQGWISSGFGRRTDPFTGKKKYHRGIDFAGKAGSEVLAVAAGVVIASERQSGYGNVVEIRHADGYVTHYAHNRENLVKVGDWVEKGETIAILGSTGRSSGPHVHFEVRRNGKVVNPSRFIKKG